MQNGKIELGGNCLMKRSNLTAIVATTLFATTAFFSANTAFAGSNCKMKEAKTNELSSRLEAFSASLTSAQKSDLAVAVQSWKNYSNDLVSFQVRVEQDVKRILTPSQASEFLSITKPSSPNSNGLVKDWVPGTYYPYACSVYTYATFAMSVGTFSSCPGIRSLDGTLHAYFAADVSGRCLEAASETCQGSVDLSQHTFHSWYQAQDGACSEADSVVKGAAHSFFACGGTVLIPSEEGLLGK